MFCLLANGGQVEGSTIITIRLFLKLSKKWHLEFTGFFDIVETWEVNILKNAKTCWISMLEPLKCSLHGKTKTIDHENFIR